MKSIESRRTSKASDQTMDLGLAIQDAQDQIRTRPSSIIDGRTGVGASPTIRQENVAPIHTSSRNTTGTTATNTQNITTSYYNGALSPTLSVGSCEMPILPPRDNISTPTLPKLTTTSNRSMSVSQQSRAVSSGKPNGQTSVAGGTEKKEEDKKPPIGKIGVCALDSKARSKPSRNILNRLIQNGEFEVVVFGDKVILDESVENWPVCDFLISFFSEGFPLEKAMAYAKLRRPFCVNDVPMQTVLWDRRTCLAILDKMEIPTPKRVEVNRDGGPRVNSIEISDRIFDRVGIRFPSKDVNVTDQIVKASPDVKMADDNDTIIVNGIRLSKPFVEKPTSGEDHNINIYYPNSQGGGGRRLFRKVNNKSSEKDASLTIPQALSDSEGSYIYEEFLKVENAEDVKAYTVGSEYCHAETRKSPVVDGVVKRNPNGKEIRYVTALTKTEALMASKIAEAFGQRVCGFDLLRAGDKSYVVDVNGWSFVKDNDDYYDKCASTLKTMFIKEKSRWDDKRSATVDSIQDNGQNGIKKTTGQSHRQALASVLRSPSVSKLKELGHHRRHGEQPMSVQSSTLSEVDAPFSTIRPRPRSTTDSASNLPPKLSKETLARHSEEASLPETIPAPASKSQWKLKGMVAVIRHADRTPKQKFKFTFHTKPFVDLLKGHREEVLLVGEAALASVQEAVEQAMVEDIEDQTKLRVLLNALQKKGTWIGTKVQIKPMFRKKQSEAEEIELSSSPSKRGRMVNISPIDVMLNEVKPKPKRSDSNSETTLSKFTAAEDNLVLEKLQLVMKWGGEPTHSARYQAQDLGENMRNDLLLMNRDVLKDVSVFSSSERRVTTSAQIFASAFLDEKEIDPEYIQVRKDLLDDSNAAKDVMDKVKKKLKGLLRQGEQAPEQFAWPRDGTPEPYIVARDVVELMKFHRRVMRKNYARLQTDAQAALCKIGKPENDTSTSTESNASAESNKVDVKTIQSRWCAGEDAELFKERWEKLFDEYTDPEKIDPGKISELYDTMKFDALHNRQFLEWIFTPRDADDENEQLHLIASMNQSRTSLQRTDSDTSQGTGEKLGLPRSTTGEKGYAEKTVAQSIKANLRRPSEAAKALTARPPLTASESYFNLFTGSVGGTPSKGANDARLCRLRELYRLSKILFDYIGPQEYGMLDSEKLEIGLLTSLPLLKGIVKDLEDVQAAPDAKSFVYFTKESHIYTLLNCILEGGIQTKVARNAIPELDYLSQICFELYESQNEPLSTAMTPATTVQTTTSPPLTGSTRQFLPFVSSLSSITSQLPMTGQTQQFLPSVSSTSSITSSMTSQSISLSPTDLDPSTPVNNDSHSSHQQQTTPAIGPPQTETEIEGEHEAFNYTIRITLSPGCHAFNPLDVQLDSKHCIGSAPRRSLTAHGNWKDVIGTLKEKFHTVKLPKSFLAVDLRGEEKSQQSQQSE